jgi:hypothetical protein
MEYISFQALNFPLMINLIDRLPEPQEALVARSHEKCPQRGTGSSTMKSGEIYTIFLVRKD